MLDALREVDLFEELPDERLERLAERATSADVPAGECLVRQGEMPSAFQILLEGRIEWSVDLNGEELVLATREPVTYFGAMNLVLAQPNESSGRAALASRVVRIAAEDFKALLREEPSVLRRTLQLIAPVQRSIEGRLREREKLASLGTLSAGLAHELNNPAAAARRSAAELADTLEVLQGTLHHFVSSGVEREEAEQLVALQKDALARSADGSAPGGIALADREDVLARELDGLGQEGWRLAPALAEAGVDAAWLARVAALAGSATGAALDWVVASVTARGLAAELEVSTERISEIVTAVKEYTYMDRGTLQDVDIHEGLEVTLTILGFKLKHSAIEVVRDYDEGLPRINAGGSELNQVWTNLIDNAIGALDGKGTIRIRTLRLADAVSVEIEDDGPGIPPEIQSRIFEPFFTTKDVGEGTGLGLDISHRIVEALGGTLSVESTPGSTRFRVRLPV